MYAEPVELAAGPNAVTVRFKEVRLAETLAVAHKHGVGSCQGVLHASPAGLRFEASKPADSFDVRFATLEPLEVDYLARTLRVRQKGGKTWNFTSDSADALLVFQKHVEADPSSAIGSPGGSGGTESPLNKERRPIATLRESSLRNHGPSRLSEDPP